MLVRPLVRPVARVGSLPIALGIPNHRRLTHDLVARHPVAGIHAVVADAHHARGRPRVQPYPVARAPTRRGEWTDAGGAPLGQLIFHAGLQLV